MGISAMDRRSFLKGAAASVATVAAAGAFAGSALAAGSGSASASGSAAGSASGSAAGSVSGSAAGSASGSAPASGSASGSAAGSGSGAASIYQKEYKQADSKRPDGYMCDEDWLGEAPTVADSDITQTFSADVVVLGGGHAGTQAALAAAQAGATVAVVEKHADGEIVYRGDDICSYNSSLVESWGFGPYNLEDITNEFIRRTGGRCNMAIIRKFVENSADMMDNLASIVPDTSTVFDYAGGQCTVQIAYDKPDGSSYPVEDEGFYMWATTCQTIGTQNEEPVGKKQQTGLSRLAELETYSREAAEDLGATWYCGYTGVVATQDDSGAVTGIIAQDADGAYVKFEAAKGVILATGDFGANTDMVFQLCDEVNEYAERAGSPRERCGGMTDCDGSGHKIGCWAGGMIETHPRPVAGNAPLLGFGPWGTTPCLWINSLGKRYANEAMGAFTLVQGLKQPMGDISTSCNWGIMDSKYMQYIQGAGLDHGAPNWGFQDGMDKFQAAMEALDPSVGSGDIPGLAIANKGFSMSSTVYVGNTAEEALTNAGFSGDALATALASIDEYNAMCAAGVDTDFCKKAELLIAIDTAPFYVSAQSTGSLYGCGLNTLAGLVVDENLQVLNANRSAVIPGLFAVGNVEGERYGNAYSTPSAGNNMGNAMTTGRMTGKYVASL